MSASTAPTSAGSSGLSENVSIDNIARIARGLKVKPYVLLDDNA
jgi:hypothetical protein